MLTVNALLSRDGRGLRALFAPGISYLVMIAILGIGGFFRSLQFTSLNTIAYASRAASYEPRDLIVSVSQQLSIADWRCRWRARGQRHARGCTVGSVITAADFHPAHS